MKKIFTYCSLLILTGCLSTGGTDISRNNDPNQRSNKNKDENKNNNSSERGSNKVLSSLSRIPTISNVINEKNKSVIKNAINAYNKLQVSNNTKISENDIDYMNNLLAKDADAKKLNTLITQYLSLATNLANNAPISNEMKELSKQIIPIITIYYPEYDESFFENILTDKNTKLTSLTNTNTQIHNLLTSTVRLSTISSILDAYDNGTVSAQTFGGYEKNEQELKIYTTYLLDKKRSDFSSDKDYAEWLSTNAVKAKDIKLSSFTGDTAYTDYITRVENLYIDEIKKRIKDIEGSTYEEIKASLETIISNKTANLDAIKAFIISKIKTLDTTFTDDKIFSLANYVNYYKKESYILTAIKDVKYIPNIDLDKNNSLISANGDSATIQYEYSDLLDDYILSLSKDTNNVQFKASDFKEATLSHIATTNKTLSTVENYYVFMPNVKNFIYAGGNFDSEINARKDYVSKLIKKVKEKNASNEEKAEFTSLTGIAIPENGNEFSVKDIEKLNLVLSIIQKKNPDFSVSKINNISNTVRLGGYDAKLTFSDFGLWNIKNTTSYNGEASIIENDPSRFQTNSSNSVYPFYSGINQFKTGYQTLLKNDYGNDINAGQTYLFSGNTFAYVEKVGKNSSIPTENQDVSGSAKLIINNDTGIGDLTLDFKDWYSFKVGNINFKNDDGFTKNNNLTITNSTNAKGILFGAGATFTSSLDGAMYGIETNRPTEAVGKYTLSTTSVGGDTNNDKYEKINVYGAFGVKK